ncbi:hypothetical protein ACKVMT_02560 [Halobacteriales archaeon Cl-PHB]
MMVPSSVPLESLQTVGLVLVEAIVLYVGYGALTSVLEPHIKKALSVE